MEEVRSREPGDRSSGKLLKYVFLNFEFLISIFTNPRTPSPPSSGFESL